MRHGNGAKYSDARRDYRRGRFLYRIGCYHYACGTNEYALAGWRHVRDREVTA